MKCDQPNCYHNSLPGTDKCKRHTDEKQRVRRYKLTNQKLQERINEITGVDYMASLEEEVALAQTMLEERLNAAGNDPASIIAAHEATNKSLETISKLVQVMHKHSIATGEVLSKTALLRLMQDIIGVVAEELDPFSSHEAYPGVIDRIAEKVANLVEDAQNE